MRFEKVSPVQYLKDYTDGSKDPVLNINAKDNYELLKLPKRATAQSAGYDFYAPEAFTLLPGEEIKIPTGIKAKIDNGVVLQLFPRSGLGFKYKLQLNNTVGIIDSDYYNNADNEGHIFIKVTNDGKKELKVKQGEGFAQGILLPFLLMEDDSTTAIRNGGLGSTTSK